MASSNDKDLWRSSQASNIALIPMGDLSVKASAKKSVASTKGGPDFVHRNFLARMRNKLQPYISLVLDFFDRTEEIELPSDELYNSRVETVLVTLIEHYMEFNDLGGSCEDVKKFWRSAPRQDYEDILFLLTEPSIIRNTDEACTIFNDRAVATSLDTKAAFALMYEILNGFSLDP
ncbi:hypothetical protein ACHWQZ_G012154 [Mnemiopsis leidyi]